MQRVRFVAQAPRIEAQSANIITGLALPYGVAASPVHPAFTSGVLRNPADISLPLLLEHDITMPPVGRVLRLWETDEGVKFIAETYQPADTLPRALSVGGEYVAEGDVIKALYIFEISLTNSPAYVETNYNIIAMNTQVKAQEDAILQEIAQLRERVQQLENAVQDLQQFKEELLNQMQASREAAQVAKETAEQVSASLTRAQQELLATLKASIDSELAQTIAKLLETIQKLR
jgi:outer membrane murein-binding lipoprotein Lpp